MLSFLRKKLLDVAYWMGIVWAFPLTVLQLASCLAFGCKVIRYDRGVFELVASTTGPHAWFFKKFGFAGLTMGTCILYRTLKLSAMPRLTHHEMRHVHQYMVFGSLMVVLYPAASLYALLATGNAYSDNVFEIDASMHEIP